MRPNRIRQIWSEGGTVINGWLVIPSAFSAETMAHQGWDSMTIDLQHGALDYQQAANMLTAISTTDVTPICRVPWLDPGIIMKMLDAGCYGVICPMINNRREAEILVESCRYPPQGKRSFGPIRGLLYGGPDYAEHANDTVLTFAMIETAEAVDQIDDILSVEGLDAIYVGPADLSLTLGYAPKLDHEEGPVLKALEYILEAAKKHNVRAGIHNNSAAYTKRMIEMGFDLVSVASDARLVAEKAAEILAEIRGTGEGDRKADSASVY